MKSIKSWFIPPPSAPWRTVPQEDRNWYLDYIKTFQVNKEVQNIRIMLYGPIGAGKSSFINTVETIIRETITCQASTDATTSGTSFTTKCETYSIEKDRGTYYPFVFVDLMGLEKERKGGVCPEDVEMVLKGHVKDGYTFDAQSPITSSDPYYNSEPTLNDQIHVLVCVIPGNTADVQTDVPIEKIREIRSAARNLGIPQLAILTKIDEACPEVDSDIKNVFLSSTIKKKADQVEASVGVQLNCIFPVKNYNSEFATNEDMDVLTLMALKRMIDVGKDFVNKKRTNL